MYYTPQATQIPPRYQAPIPVGLKGRPVSSIEEARAQSIDFDGSVFYFPDLANKCIYTKQINMDGTASLFMYELKTIPEENGYITRQEFEQALAELREALTQSPAPPPPPPATKPSVDLKF